MRLKPGAVGQVNHVRGDIVDRGRLIVTRRAARQRRILRRTKAAGDAGVGGRKRQQRRSARLRPTPELFDDRLPVVGSDRHHGRLGALRHVVDRRHCRLLRPRLGGARRRRRNRSHLHRRCRRFLWPGCVCKLRGFGLRLRCFSELRRFGLRCRRDTLRRGGGKPVIERKRGARCGGGRRGDRRRRFELGNPGAVDRRRAANRNARPTSVHGVIEAGVAELRIGTGSENIGIDRPGAAKHDGRDRRAGEKALRGGFPG